jgi:predicted transcriptional regulator
MWWVSVLACFFFEGVPPLSTLAFVKKEKFATEKILQSFLETKVDFFTSSPKNFMFRREIPIGKCIPDFVLVDFGKYQYKRLPVNLTYRDAFLFWNILSRGKVHIDTLKRELFETDSFISASVKKMAKSGLVKNIQNELTKVTLNTKSMNVISIETKLRNWKEALQQASNYKKFSDQSIVVIDETAIAESAVIAFKECGVGLCGATKKKLTWYVKPKSFKGSTSADREYIILNSLKSNGYKLWSLQN